MEDYSVKNIRQGFRDKGIFYTTKETSEYLKSFFPVEDVKEIWECKAHISFEFLDPITNYQKIAELEVNVSELQDKIKQLETQLLPEST